MARGASGVAEAAYQRLRAAIVGRDHLPGEHLVETALMEELGCSRATLREVLLRLTADGLTEQVPNKGTLVRKLSLEEMLDVQAVLCELEALAAATAAQRAEAADVGRLHALLDEQRAAVESHDLAVYQQKSLEFSFSLARLAGNREVESLVRRYYALLVSNAGNDPVRWTGNVLKRGLATNDAYREVTERIAEQDPDGASSVMRQYRQAEIEKLKGEYGSQHGAAAAPRP